MVRLTVKFMGIPRQRTGTGLSRVRLLTEEIEGCIEGNRRLLPYR